MQRQSWSSRASIQQAQASHPSLIPPAAASAVSDSVVLSHLLSCCQAFEGRFQELQAEHEALRDETRALRTCLERSGTLRALEIEKEKDIQRAVEKVMTAIVTSVAALNRDLEEKNRPSATTARHASSGSVNLRIMSATDWLVIKDRKSVV